MSEPAEEWDEAVKQAHLARRERHVEWLKSRFGTAEIGQVIGNAADLGPKPMSAHGSHLISNRYAASKA
ncbi:MAG TPA: hypothetical protein VGN80_18555 [Devosiaceae bacterium]|nr:hypothetical protein [Devosiaceae bacterium]